MWQRKTKRACRAQAQQQQAYAQAGTSALPPQAAAAHCHRRHLGRCNSAAAAALCVLHSFHRLVSPAVTICSKFSDPMHASSHSNARRSCVSLPSGLLLHPNLHTPVPATSDHAAHTTASHHQHIHTHLACRLACRCCCAAAGACSPSTVHERRALIRRHTRACCTAFAAPVRVLLLLLCTRTRCCCRCALLFLAHVDVAVAALAALLLLALGVKEACRPGFAGQQFARNRLAQRHRHGRTLKTCHCCLWHP